MQQLESYLMLSELIQISLPPFCNLFLLHLYVTVMLTVLIFVFFLAEKNACRLLLHRLLKYGFLAYLVLVIFCLFSRFFFLLKTDVCPNVF